MRGADSNIIIAAGCKPALCVHTLEYGGYSKYSKYRAVYDTADLKTVIRKVITT